MTAPLSHAVLESCADPWKGTFSLDFMGAGLTGEASLDPSELAASTSGPNSDGPSSGGSCLGRGVETGLLIGVGPRC